jgi:uncharacterized protein
VEWLLVLTFALTLSVGVLSGMGGGGGGFVIVPYYLFIGLPPASALATAKLSGVGSTLGALAAFKGKGLVHRKLVIPFAVITFVCALISAWLIPRINPHLFENIIGLTLIVLVPTLFIKKAALQPGHRTKPWVVAGFVLYVIFSFLQTLIGTGIGTLLVLILMFLFGLSALQANATKRVAQSVQSAVLLVLLAVQGLVFWKYGIAALAGSLIGTHIGTHIALRKGEGLVRVMLAGVMLVSGIVLLAT